VETGTHLGVLALLFPVLLRDRFKRSPLDKPLLAWMLWNWLSVLWSAHPSSAIQAAWTLSDGVILFYIATNVRETALSDRVPLFFTAGVFFTLMAGIVQSGQPASYFPNTNLFSSYLLICVFIPWTAFLNEDKSLRAESEKIIVLGLAVLGTGLLLWSGSRTAAVIFFLVMGCALPRTSRNRAILRWLALATAAAAACLFTTRWKNWTASSLPERLLWWEGAIRLFRDHPWVGSGIGNFGILAPQYARTKTLHSLFAHSAPLQTLSETGVIGFGLAGFLVLSAFRWVRSAPRTALQRGLALGLGAALLESLIDYNLSPPAHWMLFAWMLGLASPAREPTPENPAMPGTGLSNSVRTVLVAAFLLLGADLSTRPWRAHVWARRGFARLDAGTLAEVPEDLRRARQLDPTSLETLALDYRWQTRLARGEGPSHLEEVEAELNQWRRIPATGMLWKALADLWEQRGEKDRAARCRKTAAAVNPLMVPS